MHQELEAQMEEKISKGICPIVLKSISIKEPKT